MDLNVFAWLSTGLSTIFSVAAIVVAILARRQVRFPHKRLSDVELEVIDLQDQAQSAMKLAKKINARIASREAREKKTTEEQPDSSFAQLPGESGADWKRRMRLKIQQGGKP